MELLKTVTLPQIVLAISQFVLIYALLIVYFRVKKKNSEIATLKEELNTSRNLYSSTYDALQRNQKKLGDQVTEFTDATMIYQRKVIYLIHLLKTLNTEWYKSLRVYDEEQALPALKLSTKFDGVQYQHYAVTDYKGKVGYANKTDFLMDTHQGKRRLSKLITQLEAPVPENGVLPSLTELHARYVK